MTVTVCQATAILSRGASQAEACCGEERARLSKNCRGARRAPASATARQEGADAVRPYNRILRVFGQSRALSVRADEAGAISSNYVEDHNGPHQFKADAKKKPY